MQRRSSSSSSSCTEKACPTRLILPSHPTILRAFRVRCAVEVFMLLSSLTDRRRCGSLAEYFILNRGSQMCICPIALRPESRSHNQSTRIDDSFQLPLRVLRWSYSTLLYDFAACSGCEIPRQRKDREISISISFCAEITRSEGLKHRPYIFYDDILTLPRCLTNAKCADGNS